MSPYRSTPPLAAALLVLVILASPSVLIAGAVQIAALVEGQPCASLAPCFGGGR